jgi:hypothetical protein
MKATKKTKVKRLPLQQVFDAMTTKCMPWHMSEKLAKAIDIPYENHAIGVQWTATGIGFGEFWFKVENGKTVCDNEGMSKEFIKQMLCQMVDDCVLKDKPRSE